ncbi:MAG: FtsB family cell division protein [Bacillota bacterium]
MSKKSILNERIINIIKRMVTSKKFILVAVIVLVGAVYSFLQVEAKVESMKQELTRLESKAEHLSNDIQILRDSIERMDSNKFVEEIARKDLGLVKPGETLYIVVDNQNDDDEDE